MKKKMKKTMTSIVLTCAVTTAAAPVSLVNSVSEDVYASEQTSPSIIVDGTTIQPPVAPYIFEGSTMVPLRAISEFLGASVEWDGTDRSIHIEKDNKTIDLTVDQVLAHINGQPLTITAAPTIVNGSTMVPLRFIGEALDCEVAWDGVTKTVYISTTGEEIVLPEYNTDAYGRVIRTTNLPTNADEFPYIVESVPNWVYEAQTNIRRNNIWGAGGIQDNTTGEIISKGDSAASVAEANSSLVPVNLRDGVYDLANKFVELQTNIDYTTIDESWVDGMLSCFSQQQINSLEKQWVNDPITTMRGALESCLKMYKEGEDSTTCEYEVLPETVWVDYLGLPHFSVYVKFTPTHCSYDGEWRNATFGADWLAGANKDQDYSGYTIGQTYEAVVTYTLIKDPLNNNEWKIDYSSCDIDAQITPAVDVLEGVKPANRNSNRHQVFYFWYLDPNISQEELVTRYGTIDSSLVKNLTH